jgi:hypothetical protein
VAAMLPPQYRGYYAAAVAGAAAQTADRSCDAVAQSTGLDELDRAVSLTHEDEVR